MDFANRNRIVQQVAAQFADPTDGTMAGQRQPEDQLIEPILGHGEIEKNLIGTGVLVEERIVEGIGGPSALSIDELSANLVFRGQPADRHSSRQCMQTTNPADYPGPIAVAGQKSMVSGCGSTPETLR